MVDLDRQREAPADLGIVDGLVQASFAIQAILAEVAAEHDLSMVQLRLLGILRDRRPRMTQLAHVLGLTKSSATGLVDRAERRGLVRRTTVPVGDERAVHVVLTGEGEALVQAAAREIGRRLDALAQGLSQPGRKQLSRLLSEVVAADAKLRGVDLDVQRRGATAGLPL